MKGKITTGKGFKGALKYIFDYKNEKEKNPELVYTNMCGENIDELAKEFKLVANSKSNIKKPVYHMSLTLPKSDGKLNKDNWENIVFSHLEKMGIDKDNHQFVVVRHNDTEHDHVHILLNKVGFDGKVYHPQNDVFKIMKSTNELEQEYNLNQTKTFKSDFDHSKPTDFKDEIVRDLSLYTNKKDDKSFKGFLDFLTSKRIKAIFNYSKKTNKVSGVSFQKGSEIFKGSDLNKRFGWKNISKKLGYTAQDFEDLDNYSKELKARDEEIKQKKEDYFNHKKQEAEPTVQIQQHTNPFDKLQRALEPKTQHKPQTTHKPKKPRSYSL